MKKRKNSVVIARSRGSLLKWHAKFDQILGPRRKRAWSSPAKTNPITAVNFGWWLKNYES